MGGGLDGLMGESSNSSKRSRDQDEDSQEAVDNMLSNILKKAKTELKHISPNLLDSQTANQSTPPIPNYHQQYHSSYQNMAMPYPPPLPDMSQPPPFFNAPPAAPFVDLTKPPPNFAPQQSSNGASTHSPSTSAPKPEETVKIERKWGNILKPSGSSTSTRRASESNASASPSQGSISPAPSDSPWARETSSAGMASRSPASAPQRDASEERDRSRHDSSSSKSRKASEPPVPRPSEFKDIMSFDIDPVNMTYCGKEFIDIVDIPSRWVSTHGSASRAICHLCQLSQLMPQDLALHLDGEAHYKNLRNFIMEKEYDLYGEKLQDPLHVATFPDFNTYMLRRYPSKLEEYFEKTAVIDPVTMKTRTEFELKYKPAKMWLAETGQTNKSGPKAAGGKQDNAKDAALSECPYCSEMIALHKIVTHSCDAMRASEREKPPVKRLGQPIRPSANEQRDLDEEKPLVIPADAVDVQLKLDMCVEYGRFGICQYGKKCMFAHSAKELNTFTYRRTKTKLCDSVSCLELCGNAHSQDELIVCSKTALCRSYIELESCQYKGKCQFAHGVQELISPWDNRPLAFGGAEASSSSSRAQTPPRHAPTIPLASLPKKSDDSKATPKSKIKLTLKKTTS